MQRRHANRTFSTDTLQKNLWMNLYTDFRPIIEESRVCLEGVDNMKRYVSSLSISQFRTLPSSLSYWVNANIFKRVYQLETLWKRYRFEHDLFNDTQLADATYNSFLATQDRIKVPFATDEAISRVIARARQILSDVLGEYSTYEHFDSCSFGKRAAVGVPRRNSYLDEKVRLLTGSQDHIEWFKHYLEYDNSLSAALNEVPYKATFKECDVLGMTVVPKNYKAHRTILANTVIGSFYTAGLGSMIERRLRTVGIDIRRQQERHRHWIKRFSQTLSHVTADLSAASDSFTEQHLKLLLPTDWYKAVLYGAVRKVDCNGQVTTLHSLLLMGLGHTFPLQTLLFYALLRSVKELVGCSSGRVSVYGDDLIYPRRIHHYVKTILTRMGFVLNNDKTFVDLPFRESCGEDFFSGVAVRPFNLKGTSAHLAPLEYEAYLYKVINGLLRRWDYHEIPITFRYLMLEVLRVSAKIKQIPPSFPDYSGIRTGSPQCATIDLPFEEVRYTTNGTISFRFLCLKPRYRYVPYQYIYLWDKLRCSVSSEEEDSYLSTFDENPLYDTESKTWIHKPFGTPSLIWRKVRHFTSNYRGFSGNRICRMKPYVPSRVHAPRTTLASYSIPVWN